MANANETNGFTPIRHLTGGTIRMSEHPIVKEEASAIFSGDAVIMHTTGKVVVSGATPVNLLGVFAGCRYRNAAGETVYSKHWPAAQATLGDEDAVAYVYDDPYIVYAIQHDGTGAIKDNNGTFDLTVTAGSTSTGRSNQELSTSSLAADAPIKQIGLVKRAGNAWGEFAEVEVVFEDHVWGNTAGTADAS